MSSASKGAWLLRGEMSAVSVKMETGENDLERGSGRQWKMKRTWRKWLEEEREWWIEKKKKAV